MNSLSSQSACTSSNSSIERFINDCYHDQIRTGYPALVQTIRSAMDREGMAVLENFIHPDFVARMQSTVERLTPLCYKSEKRKPLVGSELKDTEFAEVAYSDFTLRLVNDILSSFNVHLESSDIYPVAGILVGDRGQDTVNLWHFDATYLTIAMPVVMPPPSGQKDGKFRIWPNVREFSQSPLRNRLYCNVAKLGLLRRLIRSYDVNFIPGNLYFFYGFRSYHGTCELDSKQLRANCLINCGGPLFDREKGRIIRYK